MSDNKHGLLCKLKDMATQLGRTPQRDEFAATYGFQYKSTFGGWAQFVQASGLDPARYKPKEKIDSILLKKVDDLTKKAFTPNFPIFGPYPKIVTIGDLHQPWTCPDSLSLIYALIEKIKPEYIVTLGDEYDFFAQSSFPKHIQISPEEEVSTAQKNLIQMFETLHKIAPKAKKYAIKGNHSIRPIKRLIQSAPELLPFFDLDQYFKFPHCETILDPREPLIISGIAFHHGFMGHGQHMRKFGMPTVTGHLHKGQVTVDKIHGKWLFEMDSGYVGRPETVAFNYTPVREGRWSRGMGLITEFGPQFIPFE
jgi:predicted MPP superfamily phosphohydrolase